MISWLQTNLEKHFRTVFIVLLVVIVVAFVFTIGNQGSFGGADRERAANLAFFDVSLNTQAKKERFLRQDPQIAAMLGGYRQMPDPYFRAAALHVANVHSIPEPTQAELEEFIKSRPIFQDRTGSFNPQTYSMIIDNLKLGGRATEADMIRVLKDEYRISKVREVLAGPGYTDKDEILDSLRQSTTKWNVMVANYDLTTYNPDVEITDEALQSYFDVHKDQYRTPVRRSVSYIEFDASSFVDKVNPTDDELSTYFENNYSKYQPKPEEPKEGEEAKPVEPVTLEQARPQVREDYRQEKARDLALETANDLVIELIETESKLATPSFDAVMKEFSVEPKTTAEFAANERPIGANWPQDAVRQAFLLTKDKYYSDPFQVGDNAVVMFYHDEIPSILPQFETLRARVTEDYRQQELAKLRQEHAKEVQGILATATESKEAFGAAAELAGLTVNTYSDFSAREPAQGLDSSVLPALRDLDVKSVSEATPTRKPNQVAYVYAISKEVPEVSEDSPEYQQTASYLSDYFGNYTANNYLSAMVLAESQRSGISVREN